MSNEIMWTPGMTLEQIEKDVIQKALEFYRYNKTTTAASLGISSRTLHNKLEIYEKQKAKEEEETKIRKQQDAESLKRQRGQGGVAVEINPETTSVTAAIIPQY